MKDSEKWERIGNESVRHTERESERFIKRDKSLRIRPRKKEKENEREREREWF